MATRRHFTQEYKDQAVNLVLDSGRSIAEVAKSIGVHEMTLGKWVKKARDAGRVPDNSTAIVEQGYALGRPSRIQVKIAGQQVQVGGSGLVVADGTLHL